MPNRLEQPHCNREPNPKRSGSQASRKRAAATLNAYQQQGLARCAELRFASDYLGVVSQSED